ncbi:MAG: Trp family transcriptional regulator [Patescibacteria group bacterium]
MAQVSKHPLEPNVEDKVFEIFIDSIKKVQSSGEVVAFLNDLLTPTERIMLAKRVAIAFLLVKGERTYRNISKTLRVSSGTIAKVHAVLALQGTGYRKILINILNKQAVRKMLSELPDIIKPMPSKGQSRGEWHRARLKEKRERERKYPL